MEYELLGTYLYLGALGIFVKIYTHFSLSIEEGVVAAAVDSHPRRTNGFLTGCLINVLKDYARPTVEDLPRYGHTSLTN